jgi:penicillin-binding protein 1A
MTSAYSVIANGGVRCDPIAITKVTTAAGKVVFEAKPKCKRVISAKIAATVTAMLEGVVDHGTGRAAQIGRPQAGKTGTGQEYRDAWFMGFIRQMTTGVWVGYSRGEISMDHVTGNLGYPIRVFGGTFPARIWHDYMVKAVAGLPVEGFPEPPPAATGAVPNVVGQKVDAAKKILADANFTSIVQEVPSLKPVGEVVAQNPAAGATAELGSGVTIQVSNGQIPVAVVPNVLGLKQTQAENTIKKAGLNVVVWLIQVNDPKLDGIVLSQDPPGGTKTNGGTTVNIYVGTLGPLPTPSPSSCSKPPCKP